MNKNKKSSFSTNQYQSAEYITILTPLAYQPRNLQCVSLPIKENDIQFWSWLHAYMPSAFIHSVHSYPAMPLARQLVHQRYVHPGPLVLRTDLLKYRPPTADRDRPVSRRSKPSSRTALICELQNPWDLLQPQDAMSRHRGAKPPRRYGRSGAISLLSPEYLLSVERWRFHTQPPDHQALLSHLLDLQVSQSSFLLPLHSTCGCQAH